MEPRHFYWPILGNTEPICPHCHHLYAELPARTKKCPACKQKVWVRTRPIDRQRVLVNEQDAKEIDEQWTDQSTGISRSSRENDGLWARLNKNALEAAKVRAWGQLRCIRFDQGHVLKREGKNKPALSMYFEVFLLDVNGAENEDVDGQTFVQTSTQEMRQVLSEIDSDPDLRVDLKDLRESIAADLERGFGTPEPTFRRNVDEISPVLCFISEICVANGWNPSGVRSVFLDAAKRWETWKLPVSAEEAWSTLSRQMEMDQRMWG